MTPRPSSAEYLREYKILVTFDDDEVGVVDLQRGLWGEVFEPLRDVGRFRRFRFDPEIDTVVWPTGADLSPEYLHEHAVAGEFHLTVEASLDRPTVLSCIQGARPCIGHRTHVPAALGGHVGGSQGDLFHCDRGLPVGVERARMRIRPPGVRARLRPGCCRQVAAFQRHHAGHAVVGAHRPDCGQPRVRADRQGPLASVPAGDKQLQPQAACSGSPSGSADGSAPTA